MLENSMRLGQKIYFIIIHLLVIAGVVLVGLIALLMYEIALVIYELHF